MYSGLLRLHGMESTRRAGVRWGAVVPFHASEVDEDQPQLVTPARCKFPCTTAGSREGITWSKALFDIPSARNETGVRLERP